MKVNHYFDLARTRSQAILRTKGLLADERLEQQSGAASCSTLDAAPDHNKTY
jgi:hypothetical protein